MANVDHASALLKPGETAIALLTRGMHLNPHSGSIGTSGNWKIRPRDLDKVIIYHELNGVGTPRADIYIAEYVDSVQSPE